jgi:isochorismate synthase EntC
MDWKLFAQLAVTLFVAALGGWIGHHLSMRRDLTTERRKLRVSYLLEAYRKLEGAANRADPKACRPDLESAVADIQLLGSFHKVVLARKFAIEIARDRTSSLDDLLLDLRQSLRS